MVNFENFEKLQTGSEKLKKSEEERKNTPGFLKIRENFE
jgi:hypothetical protein